MYNVYLIDCVLHRLPSLAFCLQSLVFPVLLQSSSIGTVYPPLPRSASGLLPLGLPQSYNFRRCFICVFQGGSIPHITHEVLQLISRAPHLVQLPLLSTMQMRMGVSAQGGGLATFCGLAEHPSLMVLQDPTLHTPATKLEKYVMPLWTRKGKMEIDTDM